MSLTTKLEIEKVKLQIKMVKFAKRIPDLVVIWIINLITTTLVVWWLLGMFTVIQKLANL